MTKPEQQQDGPLSFGELRLKLVRLCADGSFVDAFLMLQDAGLDTTEARGLWEYLERQIVAAGNDLLAEAVRARLAQEGVYSTQMAIADAQAAIDSGDYHHAETILTSVFGSEGLPPHVARMMGVAMAGYGNMAAVAHLEPLATSDADMAVLMVDVLRYNDELLAAEDLCTRFIRNFPGDDRFHARRARIAASLNKWDEALDHWTGISQIPGFSPSVALGSRIRLLSRLERHREAHALMGKFMLSGPALSDLVTVAASLGLKALVDECIAKAVARQPLDPLAMRDWDGVCEHLLDNGHLGQVAWLQNMGMPLGTAPSEALSAARRILGNERLSVTTQEAASALTSPACLLPFPPYFRLRRPFPSVPLDQARILLVNASLVSGGAERQFVMMVKALLKNGIRGDQIDVGLFSLSKDRGRAHFLRELEATGVRIHNMQAEEDSDFRIDPSFEDRCQILPKPLRGDVVALYHLTKRLRPTVLHGWQDRASLACGFVGAHLNVDAVALSARNMQPQKRDRGAQLDDRPLFKALCDLPNVRLTANSIAGAHDYEDWLDLPRDSVPVLNNGLELDRYRNTRVAPKALDTRPLVHLTGVFRLAPNKRPLLWLNTVSALQRAGRYRVIPRMVGVGPLEDQVRAHAKSIGLEDFELDGGLVDPADIYGKADVVLLMSRVEGTPNVLLEAQAMGIAAAGCDVGGVREAVLAQGLGAGLVLPEDITAQAAADQIEAWLPSALMDDPQARTAHIRNNFSLQSLGSRAIAAYGFQNEEASRG